jgi:hypothetical protein
VPLILLDQNAPHGLRTLLSDHDVRTAYEMGWAELLNGDLLMAAETAGFEAMVTCDQNIRYQQNMAERKIALVVLSTNNWNLLKANIKPIQQAVAEIGEGTFQTLDFGLPQRHRLRTPGQSL